FEPSKYEYVLKPHDRISLRVTSNLGESYFPVAGTGTDAMYRQNQQGLEFPVEFDGTAKLPVIGRINVSGKTIREVEALLEESYSEYFIDPFVLVKVTNRKVMVFMNSGTKASIVDMPSENLTLIEAIAQVGGLTNISKSYKIKLIRGNLTDNPEIYYWNISKLEDLKGSNCILEANDIIYVDSKPQYVSRILGEIAPYLSLATTLLAIYGLFIK
ncbi:polysaccharide biosynthesis/export family protein, partial [Bacteroidales bacterium OttesenSCG-928-I21]|nr:polysaccharide biosynthesis/export family protein [Bacteroidales bacterium OttesenSCG-928-I21]